MRCIVGFAGLLVLAAIALYGYFRAIDGITIPDEMDDGHYAIMYNFELKHDGDNELLRCTYRATEFQALAEMHLRRWLQVRSWSVAAKPGP